MGRQLEQLALGLDLAPDPGGVLEQLQGDDRGLVAWAAGRDGPRRRPAAGGRDAGVRFALYGRSRPWSTSGAESSLGWQRDSANDVISGRGRIVAEFFDVGCSRRVPWAQRRQAARLLEAVTDPGRGFDAIVVGESERAFIGTQLLGLAPLFLAHGVQVWLPEVDGPVDLTDPAHQAVVMRLGERSRREVSRARYRTTAAMRAQARDQGRFLGGRPPYGYRLVDAGPHPNVAHAAWGRRLKRLDPDPVTALHVQWIFAQRLTGRSLAGIARDLNDRGVRCPSAADPGRNRHRRGDVWGLQSVRAILANPRYTGRQVWNRQRIEHRRIDGGRARVQQWNPTGEWVISSRPAHPALVSEADFIATHAVRSTRATDDGQHRTYRFAGLLQCEICGRRMDSHWVNNRPGYRCRHGHTSAHPTGDQEARQPHVYVREDELLRNLTSTLRRESGRPPAPEDIPALLRKRKIIVVCSHTRRALVPAHVPPPTLVG